MLVLTKQPTESNLVQRRKKFDDIWSPHNFLDILIMRYQSIDQILVETFKHTTFSYARRNYRISVMFFLEYDNYN